jgi:hypothetical protein
MLIIPSKKFIYIHNYRTAGCSIRKCLTETERDLEWFPHKKPKTLSNEYKDYFKVAIVRNPYDWFGSLYFKLLERKTANTHKLVVKLGGFTNFLNWWIENRGLNGWVGDRQIDFICDDNDNVLVNEIGRFENLVEFWGDMSKRFDFNPQLEEIDTTVNTDFRGLYNEENKKVFNNYFKTDFERFRYKW